MKKKILLIISILLILVLSILFLREYKLNSEAYLENSDNFSQEDIINLLHKGSSYNNYYRKVLTSNGTEEYYYKDGILASYLNSKLNYWINLSENEKEMIIIEDYDNRLASIVENFEEVNFPVKSSQLGYYSNIYNTEINFKYLGIIAFNDRETLVTKTYSTNNLNSYENKYYIDKETGVIVKRIDIQKTAFITTSLQEFDRGIKFDVVTDEDISKPDLQDFSIISKPFPSLTIW